jgi:Ser/Thr protein kinase RdoA (MazF antagonist)
MNGGVLMTDQYLKAMYKEIANSYGLRLRRIKSYDSLYKKNAVHRASTDKGKFLIKAFHKKSSGTKLTKEQQIIQVSSYIHKLKDGGYSNFPNWLTTDSGRHFVNKNGRPYYMTDWIEGRSLQNDSQDYEALGRALANLHTIRKGRLSSKSSFTKKQIELFKFQDRLFRFRLADIRKKKSAAKRWFQKHGGRCSTLADEAWSILSDPEVKQIISNEIKHPAFIHGDVTFPNIIINSSGLFLIDWDSLRKGSTYYEIAKTLANTTCFNPVQIDALLRGYEEIKPLHSAERLLISALFRLPREAWSEARSIALGKGLRGFRVLEQTWDERLKAILWVDGWARKLPLPIENAPDVPEKITEIR